MIEVLPSKISTNSRIHHHYKSKDIFKLDIEWDSKHAYFKSRLIYDGFTHLSSWDFKLAGNSQYTNAYWRILLIAWWRAVRPQFQLNFYIRKRGSLQLFLTFNNLFYYKISNLTNISQKMTNIRQKWNPDWILMLFHFSFLKQKLNLILISRYLCFQESLCWSLSKN